MQLWARKRTETLRRNQAGRHSRSSVHASAGAFMPGEFEERLKGVLKELTIVDSKWVTGGCWVAGFRVRGTGTLKHLTQASGCGAPLPGKVPRSCVALLVGQPGLPSGSATVHAAGQLSVVELKFEPPLGSNATTLVGLSNRLTPPCTPPCSACRFVLFIDDLHNVTGPNAQSVGAAAQCTQTKAPLQLLP